MSNKLEEIYRRAVAKLGQENVGAMCNVTGAVDGTMNTVPSHRHDELAAVLGRMMGSGQAIARAQSDFKTLDEAKAAARREPSKPKAVIDASAIYRKWNNSKAAE